MRLAINLTRSTVARFLVIGLLAQGGCARFPKSSGTPSPPDISTVSVDSAKGWQQTHLEAHRGEQVEMWAEGTWCPGGSTNWCRSAEGVDILGYKYSPLFLVFYSPDPMPLEPINKLIGKIGEGPPFAVGEHCIVTAQADGELELRPNDWYLDNNNGRLLVRVRIGGK
jgi:hypothetical protein